MQFDALQALESPKKLQHGPFYDGKHHLKPLGPGGAVKIFSQRMTESLNQIFI